MASVIPRHRIPKGFPQCSPTLARFSGVIPTIAHNRLSMSGLPCMQQLINCNLGQPKLAWRTIATRFETQTT